ncbi:MAG: YceI family protein [Anaerolineales bacterium]|jgi:polyisoprenoid-binding protein YceI
MSWQIDNAHSEINFTVRHMMIAKVRGQFEQFSGTVEFDPEQPENTTVDVQIASTSINTREQNRDNHLRSPDFLNAEEYPYLTFKSTAVKLTGENTAHLTGDLTIQDVTRSVTLEVTYAGMAKSPWGTTSAGFSAETTINREDWGLTWNQALETGGFLVGKEIEINVEIELVKQEVSEPAVSAG